MTPWAFSRRARSAPSSRCTPPPHRDLVTRIALAELVEHTPLFRDQRRLPIGALERQAVVDLLDLSLQPTGLDEVHRPLVQGVRVAIAQPFGLQLLVGACGRFAE